MPGEFVVTGLTEFIVELDKATSRALPEATAVVVKGALNIKRDWARRWSGLKHAPMVGRAVSYDVTTTIGAISAEIGPDKAKRQGALGNLIEYGSVNNPPIPGGSPALDAEAPKFERAMLDLSRKLLP